MPFIFYPPPAHRGIHPRILCRPMGGGLPFFGGGDPARGGKDSRIKGSFPPPGGPVGPSPGDGVNDHTKQPDSIRCPKICETRPIISLTICRRLFRCDLRSANGFPRLEKKAGPQSRRTEEDGSTVSPKRWEKIPTRIIKNSVRSFFIALSVVAQPGPCFIVVASLSSWTARTWRRFVTRDGPKQIVQNIELIRQFFCFTKSALGVTPPVLFLDSPKTS